MDLLKIDPTIYRRGFRPKTKGASVAADRTTIIIPPMSSVVGTYLGVRESAVEFNIDNVAVWDDQQYATPANRIGKDFYVYMVFGAGILLSANATWPIAHTAETSRKIGGFHCLGVSVGTISGHALTGYLQGDILPASVWDINHRPFSAVEGMVYDAGTGKWVDIYLAGIAAGELVSRYGVEHVTGGTMETFHWYKFSQWFSRIGKRMLWQPEFVSASLGSNQGTNIAGGANPVTTGGYLDTAARRMISNLGCEGMCGILWQWGDEAGPLNTTAAWEAAFDANDDPAIGGEHYNAPTRPRFGGSWIFEASCGSRSSGWGYAPLFLSSHGGSRGCAEPLRADA